MIPRQESSRYSGAGLLVAVALATASPVMAEHGTSQPPAIPRERPVTFEVNRGQADAQVKFLARGPGYTAFLTSTEAVLTLGPERSVVRVKPVDANPAARIVGEGEVPGIVRYVLTSSATPPVSASTYAAVRYVDVYPGIDLVYHGRARRLEYDFIVAPGADPRAIALTFDGVDRLDVDGDGTLVAHTRAGDVRQPRPVVYQETDGVRHRVKGGYVVDAAGRVRFRLGAYDRSRPLVIDPLIVHSTYLGGTGDDSEALYEGGASVAVDAAGNFYVAGTTRSDDFPTTSGGPGGKRDIFVTKIAPSGDLVYSMYLGSPCEDVARAIAVDGAGNAYITGRIFDGDDCDVGVPGAFVAKLDPTGTLLYATRLGGSAGDFSVGRAIAVDAEGHVYVTGEAVTASNDFPTTPGSYGTAECVNDFPRAADVFVAKLSADGHQALYSTIVCGKGNDEPSGIAIGSTGIAYVAGATLSRDFPTARPLQESPHGEAGTETGFVFAMAPDGSDLVYSTYLGGSENDWVQGIAVDDGDNAYVTGETASTDFPTTAGVLQEHAGTRACPGRCSDAFVAKIDATGAGLVYSTYLYGEQTDRAAGIAVDAAGNAYVTGRTNSLYFPIADAFQTDIHSTTDAFVAKLNHDGTRLLYASYLGGNHTEDVPRSGWDVASAIALDAGGQAYVAGYTQSYDFPTTLDAFQPNLADGICDRLLGIPCGDVFVTKVGAAGPGVVPPVTVAVTSAVVAAGGRLTATWAGIEAPHPKDSLQLYPLGAPYGGYTAAFEFTGSTAAGTLPLELAADSPPGWYELRLASRGIVIARTPPILVTGAGATTTTVPGTSAPTTTTPPTGDPIPSVCSIGGRPGCDDGDPCTIDTCVTNAGCWSQPAEGLESVTCSCQRPVPSACAGETLPASIVRRHGRVCGLFSGAGGPSTTKRLRRGMATLKGAVALVSKSMKKGKLSGNCAGALKAELLDAKDRAGSLLVTLGSGR